MEYSQFQWVSTQREIARACFYASCPFAWPVKANGGKPDWLIQARGKLLTTGCASLQDVPLGTWMDMMRLAVNGQPIEQEPLVHQVRHFSHHAGKRYKTTKFQ